MKVCYLSGGRNVPAVRFRLPFFQLLRERGHRCDVFHNHPSRYDYYPWVGWRVSQSIRRAVQTGYRWRVAVGHYDAVVLETGLFHTADASFEQRLRKVAKRLIYEIDDAVFLLFPEKCAALAKMADHVIAGNQSLANWACDHNQQVSIVPTCVDEHEYVAKDYEKSKLAQEAGKRPVIGWIGSSENVPLLSILAEPLRRLAATLDFEFRIVTLVNSRVADLALSGVNVKVVDIDKCDVIQELHNFDIGVMPLSTDDPWMRYKCNAKMIQYMAVAVPAIGSAIGFNCELISDGENGLLANADQWEYQIGKLLASAELRRRIGEAGRKTVLARFTVQSQIALYEKVLGGV